MVSHMMRTGFRPSTVCPKLGFRRPTASDLRGQHIQAPLILALPTPVAQPSLFGVWTPKNGFWPSGWSSFKTTKQGVPSKTRRHTAGCPDRGECVCVCVNVIAWEINHKARDVENPQGKLVAVLVQAIASWRISRASTREARRAKAQITP